MRRYERLSFQQAEELQDILVTRRKADEIPDQLLLMEHDPVITLGKAGNIVHLKMPPEQIPIPVLRTGRGGECTYHGPGQLIAYPILKLEEARQDLHRYLRDLEEVMLETLKEFGIAAQRIEGRTGLFVNPTRKIASIGVRASSWVTSHGVAINYGKDQSGFQYLHPCGLHDVEITSMARELNRDIRRKELEERFCQHFARIFQREVHEDAH